SSRVNDSIHISNSPAARRAESVRDSRTQRLARLRLDRREQITHVNVAVEFKLLVSGKLSPLGEFREFVHAGNISVLEPDGQQVFSCASRQFLSSMFDKSSENCGL